MDMLQWLSSSLRNGANVSAHFSDELAGCGNNCESGIRSNFFKILQKVLNKLKITSSEKEILHLLNLLCWNFKPADFAELEKMQVLAFLSRGDGSDSCWVNYHMGYYRHLCDVGSTENFTLEQRNIGRTLQATCEYIQN